MSKYPHAMIDLETLATTPDAVILSIGAIRFNPETGDLFHRNPFYEHVAWEQPDRYIDPATVEWWLGQSDAARAELRLKMYRKPLAQQLKALTQWLGPDDVFVWGNGATFDISILEHAYRQAGHRVPWKYSMVRDVRTIVHLADDIMERPAMHNDQAHNALNDAIHQAEYVSSMWQALRG